METIDSLVSYCELYSLPISANANLAVSVLPESSKVGVDVDEAGKPQQDRASKRWSDVTFLRYARGWIRGEYGEPNNMYLQPVSANAGIIKPIPNWFLLHDIGRNNDLMAMAGFCLQIMYKRRVGPWPGITFPAGSHCYYQLLGTETSAEVAMFFIRYRKITGAAALGAVTVFEDTSGKMNLLWWASNHASDLTRIRIAAPANDKSDEAARKANRWTANWPFPMRPVRG